MPGLTAAAKFIVKWTVIGLALAFVVVLVRPHWLFNTAPAPQPPIPAPPWSFADAVAHTAPAVVNIFTARLITESERSSEDPNAATSQQALETGLGSGVIVDTDGHIVTNNHVIACAQQIYVQLADGREGEARVVGTDPATDIAVLQIGIDKPPVAPLGQSDELRTGDVVLAIGTPYGLSQTVTQGIVSALGRGQLNVTAIEGFIQTDAAINEGNSGGALINARGELIGINTAVLSQSQGVNGISFAIPVNLVRGVMDAILKFGHVKRGWFGVETSAMSAQQAAVLRMPPSEGMVIRQVYADSPAAAAGLLPGDVITRIDGKQRSMGEALSLVAGKSPGEHISLSVVRQNIRYDFTVTLVERRQQEDVRTQCTNVKKPS